MSKRYENIMSLAGQDYSKTKKDDLSSLFSDLMQAGLHGLCYSSYEEGQKPGSKLSREQIEKRINIMKPYTKWVRTFSCTDGGELIPEVAKENGLKVLVGAWLSDDLEKNEKEIKNLIRIVENGHADLIAVGNEVLYRKEMTEEELIVYLKRVKKFAGDIPVGYVDAYYEFSARPAITELCDVIYANCYPFWEGCHIDYSFLYMKNMYYHAMHAGAGKKVIITETGWPNKGSAFEGSQPSHENALKYFINTQKWSREEDIDIFYFSAFDELWKIEDEGDVGAYWGLWDKDGKLKYG